MSKLLVVTFDDEKKAYEGSRALADLHREGSVSVYSAAVVSRAADGKVSVKDDLPEGPEATAVGMMFGALVGVLGGPQGVVLGAATGAAMGSIGDLMNLGVGADFLNDVAEELAPGKTAVVAEIGEGWVTPLDTRMEELGGTVIRRYRVDVENEQINRDLNALDAELDELDAELAAASKENKAKLQAKIDKTKAKLAATRERAQAKLDSLKKESDAKVKAVEDQIASAQADTKEKLQKRSAEIKSDYQALSSKLKQSWERTKKSFGTPRPASGAPRAEAT
jgi:uncharacterized membrane protein